MSRATMPLPAPRSPLIRRGTRWSARCPAATRSRTRGVFRTVGAHSIVASPADIFVSSCEIGVERRRSLIPRQFVFFPPQSPFPPIKSGAGKKRIDAELKIEIGRETSELQSRFDLVCRLLFEKKNK